MKALKFIINGEEHEIEGSGKPTELPGICEMTLNRKTGSSHVAVATITSGEIVDGAIVIMKNLIDSYITDVEIDGEIYDVFGIIGRNTLYQTGIVRKFGSRRIYTMDDKEKDSLYFEATQSNSTIKLDTMGYASTVVNFETSSNSETWTDYTLGSVITLANVGDTVYFRNKSETPTELNHSNHDGYMFTMTGEIDAFGNINYLLCKNSTNTLSSNCFCNLFYNCSSLGLAPRLPATTLADHCYSQMFYDCTSLREIPDLPATTLADRCYSGMFQGCTSLNIQPYWIRSLPAITLAEGCYYQMFADCTSLNKTPVLPATTLADRCYCGMFADCTSLNEICVLPATTLADRCYEHMFAGCTSIRISTTQDSDYTKPYRIPTTGTGTIGEHSLDYMFQDIISLSGGTPTINTTYYLHKDNSIIGN